MSVTKDAEANTPKNHGSQFPEHLQATMDSIAKLHRDHERAATPTQRLTERGTRWVARPQTIVWVCGGSAIWVSANVALERLGRSPFDLPPYNWLQGVLALLSVMLTCMILTTQTRTDRLAGMRAQLTLELAMLAEHKNAKIIALLEELRRDSPTLPDRDDMAAAAMANAEDTNAVLEALLEREAEPDQPKAEALPAAAAPSVPDDTG
jgi:uncharacterized membrane protein